MKKVFIAIALCSLCNWAFASNEPVPGSTNLLDLPTGTKLLIKQNMAFPDVKKLGSQISFVHVENHDYSINLQAGMLLPLYGTPAFTNNLLIFGFSKETDEDKINLRYNFVLDSNARIRTVSEFYADLDPKYKNSFRFVYDADPYEGMPNDVKQDLMMSKILAAIKSGNYKDALPEFERMEKLQKDLPESFYYYYIVALDGAGRTTLAQSRGRTFLKKYGTDSNYYQKVIAIMGK